MSGRGPLAAFAAFGAFWGAWGVLLPEIKAQTGASVTELGLALLLIAAAALPSMLVTGALIDRFGLRLLPFAGLAFAIAVVLPSFAGSVRALALALLVVGAASGALDVAINVAASALETTGVRLMQKAHALFSGGFLVASLFVGLARQAGAGSMGVLLAVGGVVAATAWMNRTARMLSPPAPASASRFRLTRPLILLGSLCAVAFVIESGIENWSALFLETELAASPALSALGPAFFAAAMVLGRTLGQQLEIRFGDAALLVGGSLVAASGLTLAAAAPSVAIAATGFFLGGAGVSIAAPAYFGAAGRGAEPGERGTSVATVTTVSYLGFLSGPPLIGAISGAGGLRIGIAALAAIALGLAAATASLAGALPLRRLQHPARG